MKPRPECTATIQCECADVSIAGNVLDALANLEAMPTAIDLLVGKGWGTKTAVRSKIAVRLEGSESEIAWLTERVQGSSAPLAGRRLQRFLLLKPTNFGVAKSSFPIGELASPTTGRRWS